MCETVLYNLSTQLSKPSLKKRTDLKNSLLQHLGFHLSGVIVNSFHLRLFEWVFSKFLDDCNNLFYWDDHKCVSVSGEYDEGACQYNTGEYSCLN